MRPLTLGDMMTTNVKTLREDDSLTSADWEMVVGEIRHLPVVDGDGRVVGMVSDRDVLRSAGLHRVSIGRIMSRDLRTGTPTTPALDAAVQLLASKRGALPVVDATGRLLGIVTTTDFVELARRALAGLDINEPHARA